MGTELEVSMIYAVGNGGNRLLKAQGMYIYLHSHLKGASGFDVNKAHKARQSWRLFAKAKTVQLQSSAAGWANRTNKSPHHILSRGVQGCEFATG